MEENKDKQEQISNNIQPRDLDQLCKGMSIYEVISVVSRRSSQISADFREKLDRKLEEFAVDEDNLEEIFENKEQIEVARHYESMPKPTLIALKEWMDEDIYYRNPNQSNNNSASKE